MKPLWAARLKTVRHNSAKSSEIRYTIEIPNLITDPDLIKEISSDKRRCFDVEEYEGHGLVHAIHSVWAYNKYQLVKHYTKSVRMLIDSYDVNRYKEDGRLKRYSDLYLEMSSEFGEEYPELFV